MEQVNSIDGYDPETGYTIVDGKIYYNGGMTVTKQNDGSYQVDYNHDKPMSVTLG